MMYAIYICLIMLSICVNVYMYNYKWLGKHAQIHIQSWYYANYACIQLMEDQRGNGFVMSL